MTVEGTLCIVYYKTPLFSIADIKKAPGGAGRFSVSKKSFRPAEAVFRTFSKFEKLVIEREGGSLPPSLFPCCSIIRLLSIVF